MPDAAACAPVSIVVPVRDEVETLAAALVSVQAQDYAGIIEVVVADGSEGTGARELICTQFPGVRWIRNPQGLTSAGLNRAVAAASHDIIVRCDAHSVLPAGYVRTAVERLESTGAAAVGGMQRPVGTTLFTRAVAIAMTHPLGAGDARYRLGGSEESVDTVYLGVFRRTEVEAVGGFDETLVRNQDYELNWRLRAAGGTVWFTPMLSVDYRPRRNIAALIRQYFAYGWWKRIVILRHPASRRWRHAAAPLLVALLVLSAMLGAVSGMPGYGAVPALGYLSVLTGAALVAGLRKKSAAVLLPAVLAAMHFSWGTGFLSAWATRRR